VIYNYLKFKKGMNGDQFYVIPNEHVFVKYKINRQRISEAILLLEAEGLIKTIKTKGKSTRVRLLTKVIKYEKEST
jgi:predicted transcriptional regulator